MQPYSSMKIFLLVLIASSSSAFAELKLAKIFNDNMVLQRNQPLKIWGTASAKERISVKIGRTTKSSQAGEDGRWEITLPAQKTSKKGLKLFVRGKKDMITLKNILIGEVWFCAGQSNMESPINHNKDCKEIIATSKNPQIRVSAIHVATSAKPLEDLGKFNSWRESSPAGLQCGVEGTRYISAVAYCFAREMQKQLDCPVGIIVSAWGGTLIDAWSPQSAIDAGKGLFSAGRGAKGKPSYIYNAMVKPVAGFAMNGLIWYQGEANINDGLKYKKKMKLMVDYWRKDWGRNFPLYYVQVAPYRYPKNKVTDLPNLWMAQSLAREDIKRSYMTVINDLGNFRDVHPLHKPEVARRISLLVRRHGFKHKIVADAPEIKKVAYKSNKILLLYKYVGQGLKSRNEEDLSEFEIAGSDKVWQPATATIKGKNIVSLSAKGLSKPKYFRFAWKDTPSTNLINSEGLPAATAISKSLIEDSE